MKRVRVIDPDSVNLFINGIDRYSLRGNYASFSVDYLLPWPFGIAISENYVDITGAAACGALSVCYILVSILKKLYRVA